MRGREFDFLLRGEQFHLADFAQVKLDGRVAVVTATLALRGRDLGFLDDGGIGLGGDFAEKLGVGLAGRLFQQGGIRAFLASAQPGGIEAPRRRCG